MREGDGSTGRSERLWAARFLIDNQVRPLTRIQRRLRGKLRAAIDMDDVLSSTLRRVDDLARQGRLRAVSEAQLCELFMAVAHNVAMARQRTVQMEHRLREAAGANDTSNPVDAESLVVVDRLMSHITDDVDRELLDLKRRGLQLRQIARVLRRREAGVFKRWEKLRDAIRSRWGGEPLPGQSRHGTKPLSDVRTEGKEGEPRTEFL